MPTTATFTIEGMTCDHCAAAVRAEISSLSGVVDVEVDLGSGRVTVAAELPLDPKAVASAVDEAGYRVAS